MDDIIWQCESCKCDIFENDDFVELISDTTVCKDCFDNNITCLKLEETFYKRRNENE